MTEISRNNPVYYMDDDGHEAQIEEWTDADEERFQEAKRQSLMINTESFIAGVRDMRRDEYPKALWGLPCGSPEDEERLRKSLDEAIRPVAEWEAKGYRLPARKSGAVAIEIAYKTALEDEGEQNG